MSSSCTAIRNNKAALKQKDRASYPAFGLLLIPCLCLLVTLQAQAQSEQLSISVPIPEIEPAEVRQVDDGQVMINIGKYPQGGNPGDPMLPYKSACLLVPPDANLKTVTACLTSENWEELPGEYEIPPVKPAVTWDGKKLVVEWSGKDKSRIINGKDCVIYGNDTYFPSESVQITAVGNFRQWKIVELRIWLAVYNPTQKKVRLLKEAQAELTVTKISNTEAFSLSSLTRQAPPNTDKFVPVLLSKISNPEDIETFYGAAEDTVIFEEAPSAVQANYVIITTNTIVSSSEKLADFISSKQAAGYAVKTVTEGAAEDDLTYVSGATCDQRADNIRTWLQNHWVGDGIEYVLLIGNPHPSAFSSGTSVPMKMCWPISGDTAATPTDMYFAELSNTWDLDNDGKYGEFVGDYGAGGADKNCEVKVGRIPFYGTYADLDSILQKCINYENAAGNLNWRKKVMISAAISNFGPQDNNGDGDADDADDLSSSSDRTFGNDWGEDIKSLASSASFSPYTLYEKQGVYSDGSAYPLTDCNAALTNANFINEWKNHYGFVVWWGHGNTGGAYRRFWQNDSFDPPGTPGPEDHITQFSQETSDTSFITYSDCSQLDDSYPAFVVQVSCQNAYPEVSSNLGYSLLKKGAIGTISGTRNTYYSPGSWSEGMGTSVGDNASYGYYCFDRMANFYEDIGTALAYCRLNFGTGWPAGHSWMNMVEFSIYGDPSLKLDIVTVFLTENFESAFVSGAPPDWTKAFKTGTVDWVRNIGDYKITDAAHGGIYNAMLYYNNTSSHETYLITPAIDFETSTTDAVLEFWHKQTRRITNQDTLNVYYKTSAGGSWTLLASYMTNIIDWTKQTISLPNPGSTYYIGFLGNAKYGYGVCIDDVQVKATKTWHTISGYVRSPGGDTPVKNVLMQIDDNDANTLTDANGFYQLDVAHNWSGTITPQKQGCTFEPDKTVYVNVLADQTEQNYQAAGIYDLDCDGLIGFGDISIISQNWLDGPALPGDFYKDEDDIVNFLDFAEFALHWLENPIL